MKLDQRYHCFGCGADGDVIDFAAALYGLGKKEAAVQLAKDFGLSYEDWKPPGKAKKPKPRQKSPEEQFQEAKNRCFRILADYLHLPEADRVAQALDLYVSGSLNVFNHKTNYDEYHFYLDEIEHDPYVLISILSALHDGVFTLAEVQGELEMLFEKQYILTETVTMQIRYRTKMMVIIGPYGVPQVITYQEPYEYYICTVKLKNKDLSHLPVEVLTEEQLSAYSLYMRTLGNRPDLFGKAQYPNASTIKQPTYYDIPPEALKDDRFAAMMEEATKYIGYPYVWGGSSPSTSFDCSGYISWVLNHSGWNVGRQTAQGLYNFCTPVSAAQVKPGDLVFFKGTYDTPGVSHCGIYVLVLVCLVLQALFYGWGLNLSHKAAYDTLLRLRTALQKRFEKLPLGIIQDKGTGTVKKLFVDDVDSLEVLLAHSMPEGIANLMVPIAVYVAMFFVDWKLALLSLASIPLSLVAMMTMYSVGMKKMGPYYMAGQKMNNTIIEYINGMEVVKVFNKDADSYERFRKDVSDYRDYTLAWYKAAWPWMAIYSSLLPCTIILTLPVGAWFVLCGWSALPNLILVLCLSLSIGMPLLKSLGFLPTMPQLNYKISALEQVLDAPELQQTNDGFHGIDDTITYDHVSFAYQTTRPGPDGKPAVVEDEVLHDISFTAKAGQRTALVGESGSGKSTLAKLLIHYYDPQKGSISIGGQKLCDMSLEALNSRISYVAQDQYLFNTSLLENIRLGRLTATDEEVIEAAKKAQCMEFIEKLPQGIHSMAGDAGKMLSGGQRQRISLARAILKDAPIVVLDEATAYADPENEEKMEAAIAELVKGKTLVVIAHKLPAIMNADQICVIDHGKLVAAGKHQDLIHSCPEYQKLWKAAQNSAEWKVHTAKEGA